MNNEPICLNHLASLHQTIILTGQFKEILKDINGTLERFEFNKTNKSIDCKWNWSALIYRRRFECKHNVFFNIGFAFDMKGMVWAFVDFNTSVGIQAEKKAKEIKKFLPKSFEVKPIERDGTYQVVAVVDLDELKKGDVLDMQNLVDWFNKRLQEVKEEERNIGTII